MKADTFTMYTDAGDILYLYKVEGATRLTILDRDTDKYLLLDLTKQDISRINEIIVSLNEVDG